MAEHRISRLEDLPDELLLCICSYFNQIEILCSFTHLNVRFCKAIDEYLRTIDLNTIPLKLVTRFRNEIFPRITSHVHQVILTDDLQHFPIDLENFPHLQSIHFGHSFSPQYLLNIEEIRIDLVPADLQVDLMRQLFTSNDYSNLKTLSFISYHGSTFSNLQWNALNSIENLTITLKNNVDLFELLHLLSATIEKLHIHILYNGLFRSITSAPLKLTKLRDFHLKTTFEHAIQFEQLEKLLTDSISSLQSLSVETLTRDEDYINGNQWEKCLRKLFSLQTFQCSIRYRSRINEDDNVQCFEENLFRSFSTNFWLKERKWFIHFYSTVSTTNETLLTNSFRINAYRKTFLFTSPYPYPFIDVTSDISKTKSTLEQSLPRNVYSNVRHLYYDGENLPIQIECFKSVLDQFKSINELKLDRLIIDTSLPLSHPIKLRHLNKLIIYQSKNDKTPLNINFLDLSSMSNLRYIRIPHVSLPDSSQMPKQLETLVITECRDHHFDFLHHYPSLRLLKLHLSQFDRLLENRGELILGLIKSIYTNNQTMESLQLMCPGANQSKVKMFEKQFNLDNIDYLTAAYDRKCLIVKRSEDFFRQLQQ